MKSVKLTAMELSRELDPCFDLDRWVCEGLLGELHAQLVDAGFGRFELILDVGMHIPEEELLVLIIHQLESDSLSRRFASRPEVIVGSHE